ncbi:MAG: 30S ribosomal protein S6e [DPANN group archaeon]|nr:30S ribosomal protein S6e [DPANN group archaeon]
MAELKIIISDPKTGKSHQKVLDETQSRSLYGKKIKETVKGDAFGLEGYEFLITGGSDAAGFPMRWDVDGNQKKQILAVEGIGLKRKDKGIKQRKTVAGNQIYTKTAQVNLKVVKVGKAPLEEKPAEEPKEQTKEETKGQAAEKKEGPKKEEKKKEDKVQKQEEKKDKETSPPAGKEEKSPAKDAKPDDKKEKKD